MVKLKRSPKNLELDINVAKKRAIPHFSAASSKFGRKRRMQWCGMKIRMPQNTVGAANCYSSVCRSNMVDVTHVILDSRRYGVFGS